MEPRPDFIIPPFAESCRQAAGPAWGASFEHPFVVSLMEGNLSRERFKFYQMQDARYLLSYADVCSMISTRIPDAAGKLWFIDAARLAVVVESQLHAGYGEKLGYTPRDVAYLELTPNNRAYQNHMIASAARGTLLEAMASLTPCAWLYAELGDQFTDEEGEVADDHPYADWIRTYSDPGFVTYTNDLLARLEQEAVSADEAERDRARDVFVTSARYEWMFWQQAWEQQHWPV